ncbi:peptidoglycan-binding protein [Streptomyces sp. YU58]|uniref:peptidoglycan-binding protein n=1 Tax=Streptomyces sp. SX92 TaxID=3158972 RepID=UPI0027BB167C|nr:peptidoglycan-binding protein [Streptomyces coralus]WLW58100.1 peptidoglycan-binding protein [Streptomyces coralus]
MSEPTPHVCPLCGAPRAANGTPSCACGRLASDAHREDRAAQAAAAEDFDPVRIRPFVPVEAEAVDGGSEADRAVREPEVGIPAEPDVTAPAEADGSPGVGTPDPTLPVTTVSPGLDAPPASAPSLALAEGNPARHRAALLLAGVAVSLFAVGITAGILLYQSPARDTALPEATRAPVPDRTSSPTGTPAGVEPSVSPSSAGPSATPSASAGPTSTSTATPSASAAPPQGSTSPTPTATTARPSGSARPAPVLGLGDTGPEVTELQLRLRQVGLYGGASDGVYDRQVENSVRSYQLTRLVGGDQPGVYGAATRASLEAETDEP